MSGEGGAGMEGPKGDFVRQFGEKDRTWVNKSDRGVLQRASEPQNVQAYIQKNLDSENVRKATEALEKIKQNPAMPENQPPEGTVIVSESQSQSPGLQVESETVSGQPPQDAVSPAEGAPETNPTAPVVPEAEKKEDAQTEDKGEVSGTEGKTEEAPLTEAEKAKRKKIVEKIIEHLDKELEKKSKNTENQNEKAIFDALRDRWKGDAGIKRLKDDFERLKTNSPEQLMRELLKESTIYGKKVYTDAEIDALLADKSEGSFYKTMEPEVVLQVLQRGILENGLTKEDVLAIENAQWSKDAVEQAFQKNEQAQKLVDEKATKKTLAEKWWEEVTKRPWLLVVAIGLTGIPGAVALIGLSAFAKKK